jgi:hypothetical protein
MFKARKNDDGTCGTCEVSSVDEWDKDPYLIGLNKEYWTELAKEFAEKNHIFERPTCHSEVIPEDML